MMSEKVVRLVVGLSMTALMARHLGVEGWGILAWGMALTALCAPLSSLGLDAVGVRAFLKGEAEGVVMGTLIMLRLVGGIVAMAVIPVLAAVLGASVESAWIAGIVSITFLLLPTDAIDSRFQSKLESRSVTIARLIALVASCTLRLILIALDAPLLFFAGAILFDAACGALSLCVLYGSRTKVSFSLPLAKRLMHSVKPLIVSGFMIAIYMRADQILIERLAGPTELGHFTAAVRISECWWFIPMTIAASYMATLGTIGTGRALQEEMVRLYRTVIWVAVFFCVIISASAVFVMPLLLGAEFDRSGIILAVIAWAGLFAALGVARSNYLVVVDRNGFHLQSVALGAGVNILLNLLLIPFLGGIGSAIATVVSFACAAHLACWFVPDMRSQAVCQLRGFDPRPLFNGKM